MTIEIVHISPARVHLIGYTTGTIGNVTEGATSIMGTVAAGDKQRWANIPVTYSDAISELENLSQWAKDIYGEFASFTFFIEGVSRAWCNQLVRYRVGTSFFQESFRIAERKDFQVFLKDPNPYLKAGVQQAFAAYFTALEQGVKIEDARGVLPLGTLTRIYFGCNLRSLVNIWRQRWGKIAQKGEWDVVLPQFRQRLEELDPFLIRYFPLPEEKV